tara:strand:+ start:188 stop:397 length:210 start_codon:yes stop_codon:yes gene_type:complete
MHGGTTMKWLKNLFGIKSREEKLQQRLRDLEQKVFEATRRGDLEEAGKHEKALETVLEELANINIGAEQ